MVGGAQRVDVTQHHRGRIVANRDLDLRNRFARFQTRDHRRQRRQFVGERLLQHTTRAQACHAVAETLAKSHEQFAGVAHGANGETGAAAIVVERAAHRREDRLGGNAGLFQLIEQPLLLQRELPVRGEVLHAAAAATHERFTRRCRMRAGRYEPFFR